LLGKKWTNRDFVETKLSFQGKYKGNFLLLTPDVDTQWARITVLFILNLVARLWLVVSAKSRPLYHIKVSDTHHNDGCLGSLGSVLKRENIFPPPGSKSRNVIIVATCYNACHIPVFFKGTTQE